jgi:hydrogenase/urease accessory protein HupE
MGQKGVHVAAEASPSAMNRFPETSMNSRNAAQKITVAIASLAAALAWGHPNHAEPGTSTTILHLITEPDHLLAIVAAVGVGIWGVRRGLASRKQRRD